MNQKYVLKHNEDIEKLVSKKNSVGNKYYAIYYDICNEAKIAVSVSKKCGSSPARNYEKRVVREIVRTNLFDKLTGLQCLIVIKSNATELSFDLKKKEIEQLFNKILNKINK
ncbi:MAG: ribonuclease P protein component [Bacilli bacterium]|nr:ribonuclease P protein component [Bacilli bacterium]MBP5550448.1 ribonuclease P protein component [Bacilli bacterium]